MSRELGLLSEIRFMHEAVNRGFSVSIPMGDNSKYDFILEKQNTLKRTQVKSTYQKNKHGNYKLTVSSGSAKRYIYTPEEVDIMVCYLADINVFYIIPIEELGVTTLRLYPDSAEEKYGRYKENWEPFYARKSHYEKHKIPT